MPNLGLYGSETPRIATPPKRELTRETTRGFEVIDFAETVLGMVLLPWQKWLFIHALELDESGAYRFETVVVEVARQNGKTAAMKVLSLWRMYLDRAPLVIGTAQNLDTSEEAWLSAVEMAENVPDLAAEIEAVDKAAGRKQLRLKTGERYKIAAASRRGGRGLSGDLVLLDELREHQTWDSWSAVTKTTMARPQSQVWAFSNAGDRFSVVLKHLRAQAMASIENGEDSPLALFEWSAPDDCDVSDRQAWAQANPSLGHLISERSIASASTTDPEPVFRTEVLCQWVDVISDPPIDLDAWAVCRDVSASFDGAFAIGVDVAPNAGSAAIAAAGFRADGVLVIDVIEHHGGLDWVLPRLEQIVKDHKPDVVVIDPRSEAGQLLPDLAKAGVDVQTLKTFDVVQACGGFVSLVKAGRLRHLGQDSLDVAVSGVTRRRVGDAWCFSRRDISLDISPLYAVTFAAHALKAAPPPAVVSSIVNLNDYL